MFICVQLFLYFIGISFIGHLYNMPMRKLRVYYLRARSFHIERLPDAIISMLRFSISFLLHDSCHSIRHCIFTVVSAFFAMQTCRSFFLSFDTLPPYAILSFFC